MDQKMLIKNVPHENVFGLGSQIETGSGQITSKTLAQNNAVSITLFAFDQNEEISTHHSEGDALVQVLEGTGLFTVAGAEYHVHAGECLIMPAGKPHAVYAEESFKMILTVVFPVRS